MSYISDTVYLHSETVFFANKGKTPTKPVVDIEVMAF